MLNTTETQLLQNRLNFLKSKKSSLVQMKKSERGTQLKETETAISNIKRWMAQ